MPLIIGISQKICFNTPRLNLLGEKHSNRSVTDTTFVHSFSVDALPSPMFHSRQMPAHFAGGDMAPAATGWNSLAGNFVDPSIEVAATGPVVGLFGFDVIAQFSQRLLQAQLVQSLNQHHVSLLSAFVPWGSIALPASLLATMSMQFRLTLAVRLARFELRLVNPYIAAFHWPTPVADPIDGGEETTAVAMARIVGQQRTVDIGWQLELNVLTATPGGLAVSATASPNSPTSVVRSPVTAIGPLEVSRGASSPGGASDANWDRFTLATATAITSAVAQLSVPANLWRFGINLDFSDAVAVVSSDEAAVTDFLATDAGKSMLSQALAELNAAVEIGLTPDIAPAGALSAANVQRMGLQPFHVRDLLLADVKGDPVVCLCAQLGTSTGGVARLVQAFRQNSDFAYCVSTKVLSPALKTWWSIAATGLAITSTGPVDLPVDGDFEPDGAGPGAGQDQLQQRARRCRDQGCHRQPRRPSASPLKADRPTAQPMGPERQARDRLGRSRAAPDRAIRAADVPVRADRHLSRRDAAEHQRVCRQVNGSDHFPATRIVLCG